MVERDPTFGTRTAFGCESCGQPVATTGDRCPDCDDGPTFSPPVGRV